jgi:hypothetical protein
VHSISASQFQSALGSDAVNQLAARMGISPDAMSAKRAECSEARDRQAHSQRQVSRGPADLSGRGRLAEVTTAELARFEAQLRARLGDWKAMLRGHPAAARQMLGKLLGGQRVTLTPREENGARFYEYRAPCSFDRTIRDGLLKHERHPKRWWPQRDSNPCLLSATRFLNPID